MASANECSAESRLLPGSKSLGVLVEESFVEPAAGCRDLAAVWHISEDRSPVPYSHFAAGRWRWSRLAMAGDEGRGRSPGV